MGRILQLFKRILEKLFPIKFSVRILAAQFSITDGFQAFINTDDEELIFAPMHMPPSCASELGGDPADIRLVLSKQGTHLLNVKLCTQYRLNRNERILIQDAVFQWLKMDGTKIIPVPKE